MSKFSRKRGLAAVAILSVFATACGSSKATAPKSTTTQGATDGKNTASATGVTADTIRIGFSYPDLGPLKSFLHLDNGPYDKMIQAIVDGVNQGGGINGRKLEVTIAGFNPVNAPEGLAACTKFTEDKTVFAVLGGFKDNVHNLCVVQKHKTILISGYGSDYNATILKQAQAPWATWSSSDERSLKATVKALDAVNKLKGHKIAVEGQTPESQPLVEMMNQTLKDAGHSVTDSTVNDVLATDIPAFNKQDKIISQRFKDQGADVLFVVGGTVRPGNYDAVGWHPSVFVTQTSLVTAGVATDSVSQFPFVGAVGNSRDPDAGFNSDAMKQCRAAYKKASGIEILDAVGDHGVDPATGNVGMTQVCSALMIFVEAAKKAGANLTPATWKKGLESIGSIALPIAPTSSFGPGKYDAADTFQLEQHDKRWTLTGTIPEFVPVGAEFKL